MLSKTFVLLVLCVVLMNCDDCDKKRVKRAKYSYPSRFYRKPPPPHMIKGYFSYTPPPNYMKTDDRPAPYKPKVSKRQPSDGLGDDDINNLVKHLSKKDLDKIIEYAGDKDQYMDKVIDNFRDESPLAGYDRPYKRPERGYQLEDLEQFSINNPFEKEHDEKPYKVENRDNYMQAKPVMMRYQEEHFDKNPISNFVNDATQTKFVFSQAPEVQNAKVIYVNTQKSQDFSNVRPACPQDISPKTVYTNSPFPNNIPVSNPNIIHSNNPPPSNNAIFANAKFETEESKRQFITYVTPPTHYMSSDDNIFTDSGTMKEEQLPRPLNLRENEDYEAAYTNNVPELVKAGSYKVESFKDLPLMNGHDSKLHTVSSYHVPHYVVTSTQSQQPSSPIKSSQASSSSSVKAPPLERAPPGYTGEEMSDAHLKAVKIWTHHSSGQAYTLHDDGTLSPERPGKIRPSQRHPYA